MGNVQFLIDEASSLGHMEAIDDGLAKLRGYGIRLILMYQSLGQLKTCWPDGQDQTLLANVTQIYFGVNDNVTAEYVSNRLGEHTIAVASGGSSSGESLQASDHDPNRSYGVSTNTNDNWNQVARRLLKPEEVMALDASTAITFVPGLPPICTRLVKYFEKDFARSPGWFARLWSGFKTVSGSLVVFLAASLLALAMTAGIERRSDGPTSQRWSK